MSGLTRLTVHVLVDDPRRLSALPPESRPLDGDLAVPTDIVVTAADGEQIAALSVGEGTAWVVDHLTDTVFAVINEGDGDLLAGLAPEHTAERRSRLRF